MERENLKNRLIMALVGVSIIAFGVGVVQYSALGVDPFTAAVMGLANIFDTRFGVIYPIITTVFILIIFFVEKKLLGIVTFLNMILIGPGADFSLQTMKNFDANPSLSLRILVFIIGLVILGVGVSLCNNSELGTGSYDTLQLMMVDKIANMPFLKARIICDLTCVLIGFLGKATIGAGTLVNALVMGPIVSFFDRHLSWKFNKRKA